ncbi:peptidoglycan DD-metalloendopeptidase family protein [Chitinibacter sp. S2-10]|uniref:peptidoglycan DD-metalloendopeptidase family protein n=1 Tax=Chitinibacter sp. S2-10 TaxID=3373597 RepID=UPI00397774D0
MRIDCLTLIASVILLTGCATSRTAPAPIIDGNVDINNSAAIARPGTTTSNVNGVNAYVVKKGDTLYRIASDNKVAYQDLMVWNKLADANIKVGQVLVLSAPVGDAGVTITPLSDVAPAPSPVSAVVASAPVAVKTSPKALKEPYSAKAAVTMASGASEGKVAVKQQAASAVLPAPSAKPAGKAASATLAASPEKSGASATASAAATSSGSVEFGMPTSGKILRNFSAESKGVDIAGKLGQSIVASAEGKVVYAGAGLRGYGKMVILQHSNGYLSAYAHNDKLLVKEGDVVKKGEKIAEMGKSDTDQVKLHFEIRKGGKPVDPGKFIATE